MAITTAIANSWKGEILQGTHLLANTYKIALVKVGAATTFDKTMTNAGTPGTGAPTSSNLGTDEVAATGGYTAGGMALASPTVVQVGDRWLLKFGTDPAWTTATISAIGAIIYNTSQANKVVCTIDFGGTISSTAGTFTVDLGNQNTTAASVTFAATTLTRAAGDFVADGYKIGHTIVTSNATYPGPYTLTNVATLVLTISGTMGVLGPVSTDVAAVVIAL
jgi:hypothetical protein